MAKGRLPRHSEKFVAKLVQELRGDERYNSGSSTATSTPLTTAQIDGISYLAAYGDNLMKTSPSNVISAAIQAAI
jgi:hypothetical protein